MTKKGRKWQNWRKEEICGVPSLSTDKLGCIKNPLKREKFTVNLPSNFSQRFFYFSKYTYSFLIYSIIPTFPAQTEVIPDTQISFGIPKNH